ncbi:hypothetical protein K470DRAFT_272118 [Piedraia hortae CBS 480.64]|uniref:Uncharacterized protein n=1 Tax=Piedraia hortae CBS 480.64 TaxID=1314780 RepID=A0A6A7BVV1_9PEZI|nr:hypothetical protein K470DRAFT_272118 [Piedraia hortae CBS 480.64]
MSNLNQKIIVSVVKNLEEAYIPLIEMLDAKQDLLNIYRELHALLASVIAARRSYDQLSTRYHAVPRWVFKSADLEPGHLFMGVGEFVGGLPACAFVLETVEENMTNAQRYMHAEDWVKIRGLIGYGKMNIGILQGLLDRITVAVEGHERVRDESATDFGDVEAEEVVTIQLRCSVTLPFR